MIPPRLVSVLVVMRELFEQCQTLALWADASGYYYQLDNGLTIFLSRRDM